MRKKDEMGPGELVLFAIIFTIMFGIFYYRDKAMMKNCLENGLTPSHCEEILN